MKEVIKHKSDFFIMICPHCDCIFRYTLEDIDKKTFVDWVDCPECNTPLDHSHRKKDLKECEE